MLGSRMLKRMFYLLLLKLSIQFGWNKDRILPQGWMLTRFWSIPATGAESSGGLEQRQDVARRLGCGQE